MQLSNDFAELEARADVVWDVVVVGSGYGAGVCAARLAEAGARVCVLERGKEYERFPDQEDTFAAELRWSGPCLETNRLGLYDLHPGGDIDVLVGCGLGGTSLINANVSIEPDPRVFALDAWPEEIRSAAARGELAPYYARARAVLRPSRRPGPMPAKVAAMARAASAVPDGRFSPLELNIHYGPPGINSVGVEQATCTDCGDCVTGCNFTAKNTLPYTYLPLAKHFGARIFVQCEVDRVVLGPDGLYEVRFQRVLDGGAPREADRKVLARNVVLGAGVLGSTGILLRSARTGLSLSPLTGTRFSGNGDALAFVYGADGRLDTVGVGQGRSTTGPRGASLLSVIDARADRPLGHGIIIEDGTFPSGLAKLLRPLMLAMAGYAGQRTETGFRNWLRERVAEARDLFTSDHDDGILNHTLPCLLMGHDGADGRIDLDERGRPRIVWPQLKDRKLFTREDSAVKDMATLLGGEYVQDPLYTPLLRDNLITVHPLGGCPMGADAGTGVVDHTGRVFRADGDLHRGLYVADGSVIPTSLGVNPLLTITALSERIADHVAANMGLTPRASTSIAPEASAGG